MNIFAKKIEMTHVEVNLTSKHVTVLDITDNVIAKVTDTKALLGWGKKKKSTKAEQGQYKDLGFVPYTVMEIAKGEEVKAGDAIALDPEQLPEKVTVVGTSKGKGFAGAVKRYGFGGGPKTHGQSDRQRAPGSIGAGTTPGRVYKGTRMAGRMGSDTVKIKGLEVIKLLEVENKKYLLVKGSVPGPKGTLVKVSW